MKDKLELSMQMDGFCGYPLRNIYIFNPNGKFKLKLNLEMPMDQIIKNLEGLQSSFRPVGRPKIDGPVSESQHNRRVRNLKLKVNNSERKIENLMLEEPFNYRDICKEEKALEKFKFSLEEAIADKEMSRNKKVREWEDQRKTNGRPTEDQRKTSARHRLIRARTNQQRSPVPEVHNHSKPWDKTDGHEGKKKRKSTTTWDKTEGHEGKKKRKSTTTWDKTERHNRKKERKSTTTPNHGRRPKDTTGRRRRHMKFWGQPMGP